MVAFYSPAFQAKLAARPEPARAAYVMGMAKRAVAAYISVELKAGALVEALDATRLSREAVDSVICKGISGTPLTSSEAATAAFIAHVLDSCQPGDLELLRAGESSAQLRLASATGQEAKSIGQRRRRLLERITQRVNDARAQARDQHTGPGSRQATSNSTALAATPY